MDRPQIVLRAARPEFEEGLAFARYVDQASEGFFRFLLGRRDAEILARAYLEPGHDLSHEHTTFAERDGAIVGMVSAYSAEQHSRSTDRPLKRAAGRGVVRLWLAQALLAPLMRLTGTVAEGDFYVLFVAVDPQLRGEGVGALLMDFSEEQARRSGSTRLVLDVSAENPACRFYERRGMVVESRWPRRLPIAKLKFYRMTRPL